MGREVVELMSLEGTIPRERDPRVIGNPKLSWALLKGNPTILE